MRNYKKPARWIRDQYHTNYAGDDAFAAQARLLQSIWREDNGHEFERYGNSLPLENAKENGINFLTPRIKQLVEAELANNSGQRKVIQEPRIWNNLLSSQPLAFNLFGELKFNLPLATKAFATLFPERHVQQVTQIEFEYSPQRKSSDYTNDSSAFDVFVVYENQEGKQGFFGIEVKYSEQLKETPATHKKRYEEISAQSKVFDLTQMAALKAKPLQQIWRDHLLALSMFKSNNDYAIGDFLYLFPAGNRKCSSAVALYRETLVPNQESHFHPLVMEDFVTTLEQYSTATWITDFNERYLNFARLNELEQVEV